ncbi:MAG: LysM peptidoglycan-binding domain-containing protein [Methanosarcina sp.]
MTLVTLAEQLRASAKREGSIALDSATLTAAGLQPPSELDALVARAFQLKQLKLATTEEQVGTPTETQLTVTGALTALGVTAAQTKVIFTVAGTAVSFTMESALPASWELPTSFSGLSGFPFADVEMTQPAYLFSTGKVEALPWAGGTVALSPGLNLAALGEPGEGLGSLLLLVPGAREKPLLSGTIDPGAFPERPQKPDVELAAELFEGELPKLGFLQLDDAELGLEVRTQTTVQGREQYSDAYLLTKVSAADTDLKLDCRISIGPTASRLTLFVGPPEGKTVTIEDVFAMMGGRSWFSTIPAPLQALFTSVGFKGLEAAVSTTAGNPSLDSVSVTVGSTKAWPLFDGWEIESVDFTWIVDDPLGKPRMSGVFGGRASFFPKVFTGVFYVTITTDLRIDAGYEGTVSLAKTLQEFSPGIVLPGHMDIELTGFGVSIDKPRSAFAIAASASASMDVIGNGSLTMANVELLFAKAPNSTHASLVGSVSIGGTSFGLEASYEDGAWKFDGGLKPGDSIPLGALVDDLLGAVGLPKFVPESLEVTPLRITAEVPGEPEAKGSYSLEAGTKWVLTEPGSVLDGLEIDAGIEVKRQKGEDSGSIFGEAHLPLPPPLTGMSFDVGVGYEFTAKDKVLWVEWKGFATAEYSFTNDQMTFRLQAASLGSLLTELIRIIEGDPEFTLPAPWNLLEQISLKAFSVVWRLKPKKGESPVQVNYDLEGNNIKLFFIEIESFGFTVKDSKVQISLSAKMLGQTEFEEMEFPATAPPAAPGGDTSIFELDLLALGQRVSVEDLQSAKTVGAAVKTLKSFNAPEEPDKLPVPAKPAPGQPYYAPDSAWLVGTGFKVLVDEKTGKSLLVLEAVFNDPRLYGLRVALAGEKAGPLAGLDFEILYRKVSDTVGVYQIQLTLPEVMRHIELGEVSVTLPVIGLDIYTNGNFRVDFGFPANLDFSRSAGVQAFPFMGQGGFYFGVLGSQTAGENVPATKRGSFDPVIVFGIGLRLGLGKSISEGIFSAELSVTVIGIVEGVLATFHPYTPPTQLGNGAPSRELAPAAAGDSLENQYYWWLRGTIGVIGKVSGSVNFAIISASVDVTIQAFIQLTVEAHRAIPVHVEAGVSVGITVKINLGLFSISLHFSFSLTVKADFLIGSDSEAPWDEPKTLAAPRRAPVELPPVAVRSFAALAVETAIPLTIYAAPQLTLADWTEGTAPRAAQVAMLYLEGPVGRKSSNGGPSSFEVLARETLLWALANFGGKDGADRAEALAAEITREDAAAAFAHFSAGGGPPPVAWADLRKFLSEHFAISVQAPPGEGLPSATAFPILPDLTLAIPAWGGEPGRTVDFSKEAKCGKGYLEALAKILAELRVQLETELEREHASQPRASLPGDPPEQSLATFIAEDWFALLCRHMLQATLDAFDRYSYVLPGDRSLQQIAEAFPAANALTPEALGAANAGLALSPGAAIVMRGVTHPVTATDTWSGIASHYGVTPTALAQANADLQGLLVEGAELDVAGKHHRVDARDSFAKIVDATKSTMEAVAAAVATAKPPVLVPLAVIAVPDFVHRAASNGSETLGSLAAAYGLEVGAIAAANATTSPFFRYAAGETVVDVPGLSLLSAELLVEELAASQVYTNLAGVSSRFLLDGLRLPVTPEVKLETAAPCAKAQSCGLQSLLGQQVTLPGLGKGDAGKYALTLGRGAEGGWIALGSKGESLPMVIDQAQIERIEAVLAKATPALRPDTRSVAALPATAGVKRRFALTAASPLRLPAGLAMPGGTVAAPTVLGLPEALLAVLADPDRARPAFSLQRTDPGPGGTTVVSEVGSSSWAVLVPVTVSRIAGAPEGTYELVGTDQTGIVLLERLLEAIGNHAHPIFGTPQVLYPPAATDPQPTGLAGGDPAQASCFVVQANLSTETNPQQRAARAAVAGAAPIGNKAEELVRLLWECSIVASGGFYLHYESAPGSPGLPGHLFDAHGRATFQLLVQLRDQAEGLGRYVNAAVLGEAIDPTHTTVFAQSEPRQVEITLGARDSLAGLAARHHLTVDQLAQQLAEAPLRRGGPPLTVEWAIYETRAGDTLEAIAREYGTTAAAIEAANPELTVDWRNLPPWTLLRMPSLTASVGATGPATLADFAAAHSLDAGTLGWLNRDVTGIFEAGRGPVRVEDGIVDATATVPPGVAGFAVERRQLTPEPADEVAEYLDSTFHLLGWQLIENVGFRAGPPGLPVGPAESLDREQLARLRSLRPAPALPEGGELLTYEQLFPVAGFSKEKPAPTDEHVPPPQRDPYIGVGSVAQPRLEWRDLFGNRARTPLADPSLEPKGPANQPPVPIAYTDRLLGLGQWPSAAAIYGVASAEGGDPQIKVTIGFDPSRYAARDAAALKLAEADREAYARSYYQLHRAAPGGTPDVSVALASSLDGGEPHPVEGKSLEAVRGFVLAAWQYLDSLITGKPSPEPEPPADCRFAVPVAASNQADIFEMTVTLAFERDPRLVAPESRDEDGVARVETPLAPVAAEKDETASLLEFATAFEGAYSASPQLLKLAVGTSREEEADAAGARRLWAVRTSTDASSGIAAEVSGPAVYYAPPPLSTSLVSRNGVRVRSFDPEKGLGPAPGEPRDFTDVDLDVWARQALAAIDGLLSPRTAVPAFVVDALTGSECLERLRKAKKALAAGIASRVVNVLDTPAVKDPGPAPTDAREHWEQQLLISLSTAYQADVAVQLPVTVRGSGEGNFEPPALYGHPAVPEAQASRGTASTFKIEAVSGSGFLTFMFTAADPTEQGAVPLQVGFAVDMIEHQIGTVPGIEGYRASSWLSFPIPLGSLPLAEPELGNLEVPVVLRAYPTPPTLGQQTTRADLDESSARAAVQSAARWTFLADYEQLHVAQDRIGAEAEVNIPGEGKLLLDGEPEDLFAALAGLLAVLPQLQAVFDADLVSVTTQTERGSKTLTRAANALAAFTELVESVAERWPARSVAQLATGEPKGESFEFEIKETHYTGPKGEDDLLVSVESEERPAGVPAPAIEIAGYEAVPTDGGARYRRDAESPFLTWREGARIAGRTVAVGPLDGLGVQNGRLALQITRNAELVEHNPTRQPFVYTTPFVRFPSICTPLLSTPLPIDVAAVATGTPRRATLAEHLQALFSTLLASAPEGVRKVQLQTSYGLRLEGESELPIAMLPVKLAPAIEFAVPKDWEAGGFTEKAAAAILDWTHEHHADVAAGVLAFDVSVFSSLAATTLPLVRLSGLYLNLPQVTDA